MTVPIAGRAPQVMGVAGFFLALSTIAVVMRSYTRAFIVRSFGLDDWTALLAWVFFVFFCGFAITGCHYGTGQHAIDLPPEEIPIGLKWWWACEPVYVLSSMSLKFSIGVMLYRIAVARVNVLIIWTVVVVIELFGTFYFFLFVLQCRPSAYFWTQYTGGKGSCINPKITVDATYAYSAISCWADWTLATVPVFMIWDLRMNIRTKVGVSCILAMGAIASIATIVRIPYVKDLADQADFLYATTDVAIWSTSETGLGLTACSLATCRPLFRSFFGRNKLLGGSSSNMPDSEASPWPESGNPGYVLSSDSKGEDIALRNDVAKDNGVRTYIQSDLERGDRNDGRMSTQGRKNSFGISKQGWNASENKLRNSSSDEEFISIANWGGQIRKTTVQTQTSD